MIEKKEFIATALDPKYKTFIVYVAIMNRDLDVHLLYRAQIGFFKADEVSTFILSEYADFRDIFFKDLAAEILKCNGINNYAID